MDQSIIEYEWGQAKFSRHGKLCKPRYATIITIETNVGSNIDVDWKNCRHDAERIISDLKAGVTNPDRNVPVYPRDVVPKPPTFD